MNWEQAYIWIYKTQSGIKARVLDEGRFAEALRAPGHKVCEVEAEDQRIIFNVAYPKEWSEEQPISLIKTQVRLWPMYNNGEDLRWSWGGIGGPEEVKKRPATGY